MGDLEGMGQVDRAAQRKLLERATASEPTSYPSQRTTGHSKRLK